MREKSIVADDKAEIGLSMAVHGSRNDMAEVRRFFSTKQRLGVLLQAVKYIKGLNAAKEFYPYELIHNRGNNACGGPIFNMNVMAQANTDLTSSQCIGLNGEVLRFDEGIRCGTCHDLVSVVDASDARERT